MLSPDLLAAVETEARKALGGNFRADSAQPVGGGDISSAFRLGGPADKVFVKVQTAGKRALFQAEAEGLRALAADGSFRVPAVLGIAEAGEQVALLLEWLDLRPLRETEHAIRAGAALAALHRAPRGPYGWPTDNFIGETPQRNAQTENWSRFYVQHRLQPQLERAAARGFNGELQRNGERICERAPAMFLEYRPVSSLLHGDLWHGNVGVLDTGEPALFDPACYCGDREADLAMTELFGGFPLAFYSAYRQAWPLDDDYERRKPLYNLYHVLNHLNQFGKGYLSQAERMAAALATELAR
jgi:protein-ribulosamine 3-kinase